MKERIYEYHIFELRKYKLDRKKIIAVKDTTYVVVKRKPENNQACTGFEPHDLCDTGTAPYEAFFFTSA